jgi:hypothetical protein
MDSVENARQRACVQEEARTVSARAASKRVQQFAADEVFRSLGGRRGAAPMSGRGEVRATTVTVGSPLLRLLLDGFRWWKRQGDGREGGGGVPECRCLVWAKRLWQSLSETSSRERNAQKKKLAQRDSERRRRWARQFSRSRDGGGCGWVKMREFVCGRANSRSCKSSEIWGEGGRCLYTCESELSPLTEAPPCH